MSLSSTRTSVSCHLQTISGMLGSRECMVLMKGEGVAFSSLCARHPPWIMEDVPLLLFLPLLLLLLLLLLQLCIVDVAAASDLQWWWCWC